MYSTIARPSRDLRNNYADVIRSLKDHNQILITNNGRGEAILISVEDYSAYEEYLHIRYVDEKLREAEARATDPSVKWLSYADFLRKHERNCDV